MVAGAGNNIFNVSVTSHSGSNVTVRGGTGLNALYYLEITGSAAINKYLYVNVNRPAADRAAGTGPEPVRTARLGPAPRRARPRHVTPLRPARTPAPDTNC